MAFRTEDFKLHSRETTLVKMYFMIKIKIEKVYELYTSDGFIARGKAKADGEAERRVGTKPKLSINDVQGTVHKAPSANCSLCLGEARACARNGAPSFLE